MKPTAFRYEVNLRVELTRREVDLLIAVCDRHYDFAVRGLAAPGEGAVLNAFRNHLNIPTRVPASPEDTAEGLFTYRQLDTLAKGLENAGMVPDTASEERKLYMTVKKLMKLVNEEYRRVGQNELAASLLWVP